MRKNKSSKGNGSRARSKTICVEFTHSTASVVAIAGTFNDWRPEAAQLVEKGRWQKQFVLAPGTYEYLFVADGTWLPDPLAKETVPNPFGGVNSLLRVPSLQDANR